MRKTWQKFDKKKDSYIFYSLDKAIRNKIIFNNMSLLKTTPKQFRKFGHNEKLIERTFRHYFKGKTSVKTDPNMNIIITVTESNAHLIDLIVSSESSLGIGKMFLMVAVSDRGLNNSKIVSRVLQDQDATSKRFNAMEHEHFYAYPFYDKLQWADFRKYFINLDNFNEDLYYIPMFLENTVGHDSYGDFIDKMDSRLSPFSLNDPKYLTLLINVIDILQECDFLSNKAKHFTTYDFGSLFNLTIEIQRYNSRYGIRNNQFLLKFINTVLDDKNLSVWDIDHFIKDKLEIESKNPDSSMMERESTLIALIDLYTRLSSDFKDNDFYDLCMNADSRAFSSEINLDKIEQYFKEPRAMSFEMWVNIVLLDK